MGSKVYAVVNGLEGNKIYKTWDEAKKNVNGVKGVRYKGFTNQKEAVDFITSGGDYNLFNKEINDKEPITKKDESTCHIHLDGNYHIYVDGSFREGYKCYAFGVVIVFNGEVIKTLSGASNKAEYLSMRNVAGEVNGAMEAIKWSMENNINSINLYYDYQGIESWALGTWKRNNNLTASYHEFIKKSKSLININFIKVKGHSGNYYNDMVDKLAKEAIENFNKD